MVPKCKFKSIEKSISILRKYFEKIISSIDYNARMLLHEKEILTSFSSLSLCLRNIVFLGNFKYFHSTHQFFQLYVAFIIKRGKIGIYLKELL